MEHDDQKPDRPGWLPTEREGDIVTPARAGIMWDAVQAQLPQWRTLLERMRRQPGIHNCRSATLTWLVPGEAVNWWRLPPGIRRLPSGRTVLVPPAEHVYDGRAAVHPVIHWATSPGRRRGLTDPTVLMSAIHAARVAEWMPARAVTWLPVGRWWHALRAPRRQVWSTAGGLSYAPAIVEPRTDTLAWLVPVGSFEPADVPAGMELLTEGHMEIPPAPAARTGRHTEPPPLHWTMPPGERAVIAPPDQLLRELHATLAGMRR
ncbi:hypothetical protein RM844_28620 [Streptomyces sp. DSM 44915]|uniref:Uncharacterized protein n=1 Tax=Streptomyces chisholmiae TaxID=3075540 RepID=A0ABU2JZ05_9ACTN|nr:hypothetical protein [Streptomyces sp. DSM 44915]MDT0270241.1 hypothetical protein [Streptomyces sp. DSM 44915]